MEMETGMDGLKRKGFEYFDHGADIGIRAFGPTIEEAYASAAIGMFSLMFDIEAVEPKRTIELSCNADDLDLLLVEWLNKLLRVSAIENMVFCRFLVGRIAETGTGRSLDAQLAGEQLDVSKHNPKTEVKAATYAELNVKVRPDYTLVQTVVDV